jgi:hypothetical protein
MSWGGSLVERFKAHKENKFSFLLHELASSRQAFTKQRTNKKFLKNLYF